MVVSTQSNCIKSKVQLSALTHSPNKTPQTKKHQPLLKITHTHNASLVGGTNPFEKYESRWESSLNRGENKRCEKPPPRSLPHPSRNTTSWTCWCFPPSLLFQSHHDLERRVRLSLLVWQICQNLPPMVAPPHSSLAFKGRKEGCRFAPFWGVRK